MLWGADYPAVLHHAQRSLKGRVHEISWARAPPPRSLKHKHDRRLAPFRLNV